MIIRKACSRELTDLGLIFNSLNIKVVQSEVAEARRRQSAAVAQANADIVAATQTRRAKEAQLEAERAISDKTRELEQTKASNAALVAQAEAKRQEAAGLQRTAELDATQIAQAKADAARVRLEAEAGADAEAIRIRKIAEAQAEAIQKVNQAIAVGGESYFRYRQIEMLPQIAPVIADALSDAKMVTISGGGEAGGAGDGNDQQHHERDSDGARGAARVARAVRHPGTQRSGCRADAANGRETNAAIFLPVVSGKAVSLADQPHAESARRHDAARAFFHGW